MTEALLLLILILALLQSKSYSPYKSIKYSADPIFTVEHLFRRPGSFRDLLLIEPHIFLRRIVSELIPGICLPRDQYLNDLDLGNYVNKLRRCQINDIDRIIRAMLATRNVPVSI